LFARLLLLRRLPGLLRLMRRHRPRPSRAVSFLGWSTRGRYGLLVDGKRQRARLFASGGGKDLLNFDAKADANVDYTGAQVVVRKSGG
jgi:hypothetical protein